MCVLWQVHERIEEFFKMKIQGKRYVICLMSHPVNLVYLSVRDPWLSPRDVLMRSLPFCPRRLAVL